MADKVGLGEKLVPVRVSKVNDLARMAASIAMLGQSTYLVRFKLGDGRVVYGLIALLRDYYDLYGLPILYYAVVESGGHEEKNYLLVKIDEQGEHVEFADGARPGWVSIPIVNLAEKPRFFPDELG